MYSKTQNKTTSSVKGFDVKKSIQEIQNQPNDSRELHIYYLQEPTLTRIFSNIKLYIANKITDGCHSDFFQPYNIQVSTAGNPVNCIKIMTKTPQTLEHRLRIFQALCEIFDKDAYKKYFSTSLLPTTGKKKLLISQHLVQKKPRINTNETNNKVVAYPVKQFSLQTAQHNFFAQDKLRQQHRAMYRLIALNLLDAIGKESNDSMQLGDIHITRGEIFYTVSHSNSYYTSDFINLLLYVFNQVILPIQIYPAMTVDEIHKYFEKIKLSSEDYHFIPLNVAYDKNEPEHINHWVVLIIDKKYQLIFYLDPATKQIIPAQIQTLKLQLDYPGEIILNPINFQQQEKQEGWVRHCGVYLVEIFKVFREYIRQGRYIISNLSPNAGIEDNSISLQSALSTIPCGAVAITNHLRFLHLKDARIIVTTFLKNSSEISENFDSCFREPPNVIDEANQKLEEINSENFDRYFGESPNIIDEANQKLEEIKNEMQRLISSNEFDALAHANEKAKLLFVAIQKHDIATLKETLQLMQQPQVNSARLAFM